MEIREREMTNEYEPELRKACGDQTASSYNNVAVYQYFNPHSTSWCAHASGASGGYYPTRPPGLAGACMTQSDPASVCGGRSPATKAIVDQPIDPQMAVMAHDTQEEQESVWRAHQQALNLVQVLADPQVDSPLYPEEGLSELVLSMAAIWKKYLDLVTTGNPNIANKKRKGIKRAAKHQGEEIEDSMDLMQYKCVRFRDQVLALKRAKVGDLRI